LGVSIRDLTHLAHPTYQTHLPDAETLHGEF
jgi:hypothetical protein